jgi:hypothetical protein
MVDYYSLAAAAIGFAPPIALMFWTLQRYTYPKVEKPYFNDPRLFGMFTVGIVIGVILYAVSFLFSPAYALVGFLLEEAIKLMILNMPRFQRKADTPFYGFGLGAGMASALAFGAINRTLYGVGFELSALVLVILVSIMLALLHTSTGTTIGMGVARGTPWSFFGQAVIVHLAFVLLLAPFNQIPFQGESVVAYILFGVALVFVATYYWYTHYKLLPAYVKEAIAYFNRKKSARKERRSKD